MHSPRFGPEKLAKYPHLFPRDVPIWERFLDKFSAHYVGFDYDIKVGTGIEPPENPTYADMRLIAGVYKKRIDAVGYQSGQTDIIEVKPAATFSAIGQVLGYAQLYRAEYPAQPAVIPVLVTDWETPDIRQFAEISGVQLVIV